MALTISQLAGEAGVGVPTIRYYERRGIVPKAARSASGYRQYSEDAVRQVRFVRSAQQLGFSLEEIQELLALRVDGPSSCGAVARKTRANIAQIDQKLHELERIRKALGRLLVTCETKRASSECPVLHGLDGASHA